MKAGQWAAELRGGGLELRADAQRRQPLFDGLFFVVVAFAQVLKLSDAVTGLGITAGEILAALVYWVLTIIFSYFQERLEQRMARGDR